MSNKKPPFEDQSHMQKQLFEQLFSQTKNDKTDHVPFAINPPCNTDVKLIAFYLPQYHPIPENDEWWGKGFTEWTNVSKAIPQFIDHYQPHLPGELGFYDLRVVDVQKRQIELAKNYGIYGFCYHHYWFNGKSLLHRPFQQVLENPELDLPFCLCWANESWTRRWDGLENDVLIKQNYSPEDDLAFIKDIESALRDPRYIRINNRPLLIVYRIGMLPDAAATAKRWRDYCISVGIGDLYLVATQSFGFNENPNLYGFDALMEFAPHFLGNRISTVNQKMTFINPNYQGCVFDYNDILDQAKLIESPEFPFYRTIFPSWDNEARKPGKGHTFINATPDAYQKWLNESLIYSHKNNKEKFVFINAWNEWGEGAHLEPDRKYGYAYLKATHNALRIHARNFERKIIVVSNDAHLQDDQHLLLNIIKNLYYLGFKIELIMLSESHLILEYSSWANVHCLAGLDAKSTQACELAQQLALQNYATALVNNTFSGLFLETLVDAGITCVALIDEFYDETCQTALQDHTKAIANHANKIIFSSHETASSFYHSTPFTLDRITILPKTFIKIENKQYLEPNQKFNDYIFNLLDVCNYHFKRVTAIVITHHCTQHLKERLLSILNQSYPIYEIIIFVDPLTSNNVEIIKNSLKTSIKLQIIKTPLNFVNFFSQWQSGVNKASGDFIWLCQVDDRAHPDFLSHTLTAFDNIDVVMSYCDSRAINKRGEILNVDTAHDCNKTLAETLSLKSIIPTTSAVIFRKQPLKITMDKKKSVLKHLKIAGEWLIYAEISTQGKFEFSAMPLNFYRQSKPDLHQEGVNTESLAEFSFVLNKIANSVEAIKQKGAKEAFDPEFYLRNNPDVAQAGIDPQEHYYHNGIFENRLKSAPALQWIGSLNSLNPEKESILIVLHQTLLTSIPFLITQLIEKFSTQYNVVVLFLYHKIQTLPATSERTIMTLAKDPENNYVVAEFMLKPLFNTIQFKYAIVNSIECHTVLPLLTKRAIPTVSLLNESFVNIDSLAFQETALWSTACVVPNSGLHKKICSTFPEFDPAHFSILSYGIEIIYPFETNNYVKTLDNMAAKALIKIQTQQRALDEINQSNLFDALYFFPPREALHVNSWQYLTSFYTNITKEEAILCHLQSWSMGSLGIRKPFPGFHPKIYLAALSDKTQTVDPLLDYLHKAKPDGPWIKEVIFPQTTHTALPANNQIALHIHVFYPELLEDILNRLAINRIQPDIFISIPSKIAQEDIAHLLKQYKSKVYIQCVPNKGRDIGPFLTFGLTTFSRYEYIGHLHTKISPSLASLTSKNWREFLLKNLLGQDSNAMADTILSRMQANPSLGLVYPDDPYLFDWSSNKTFAKTLGEKLNLVKLPNEIDFPVGTMFWARTKALLPLFKLGLTWDDYPSEPLPDDGTLLHTIERLLPLIVEKQKMTCAVTHIPGLTR